MSKTLLCILDGWGLGPDAKADAIQSANTPYYDQIISKYPNATLTTFGSEVGLPDGQMGNSEVGHLNIGAGRVVYQDLAKINKAIADDTLKDNQQLQNAIAKAKKSGGKFHLMGLLSDGGVHAHIQHLFALIDVLESEGLTDIYIHAFLDGRDTDPKAGKGYLDQLLSFLAEKNTELATVIGRYFAMDRDNRWERIQLAYDLLTQGVGTATDDILASVALEYQKDITDEFMPALVVNDEGKIAANDVVLFFNYRSDRPRQITTALTQKDFPEYGMTAIPLQFYTMTKYDASFKNVHVLFEKALLKNTIGEVLEANGKTQLRIAETEKYPHVTFFFSGGREEPFDGEERILIPSPKVATYDLQPEMSAAEITEALLTHLDRPDSCDFICVNYANTDMVGHTGDFQAAIKATETVDGCIQQLCTKALDKDYEIIIIADHGNSDFMINADGSPNTAHTTNPVPIIYLANHPKSEHIKSGKLADVAVSILDLMGINPAKEMDGLSIF